MQDVDVNQPWAASARCWAPLVREHEVPRWFLRPTWHTDARAREARDRATHMYAHIMLTKWKHTTRVGATYLDPKTK